MHFHYYFGLARTHSALGGLICSFEMAIKLCIYTAYSLLFVLKLYEFKKMPESGRAVTLAKSEALSLM